ncbi:transcription factor subunit Med10 of mediator complex-domain-containing protein [Thelephora terrestris]|uniref:Mediator of RNA polymerase II transcription subunit 10 n=1 Tax=Thelephora terrestris TaxID=56493 RepID=A0A9P6L3S0_9AGAM|nr:transcription factor subunit Med10 of mediator complex-domain-containing protein [Thelephora terrestris]
MITHPASPTSPSSSAFVPAVPAPSTSTPAPDSPRLSQTPPPTGLQGDLEVELVGLANALYNLGTTVISDLSREKDKPGVGKQVGLRVNQVVDHLAALDHNSQNIQTMIPMQVLQDIDNAKNPMLLTKDRLERAATENQFMNGKIVAIESYRSYLNDALLQSFPELEPHLTTHDMMEVKLEPTPDVP